MLEPIRVLLIHEQLLVRAGLRLLIERSAHVRVVAEVDRVEEAGVILARETVDVILLNMESEEELSTLSTLVESAHEARVIVLAGAAETEVHRQVVHLGAQGLVQNEERPQLLLDAIEKVHAGELWFNRTTLAIVLGDFLQAERKRTAEEVMIESLTKRERQVIRLLSKGHKNKEIGKSLHISESTVRQHLTSIYSKLQVSDRLELIIFAFQHGLVRLPSSDVTDRAFPAGPRPVLKAG